MRSRRKNSVRNRWREGKTRFKKVEKRRLVRGLRKAKDHCWT
jgi:hypothetical protein